MIRKFKFSFEQLEISVEAVEQIMGYSSEQAPEPIPEIIEAALLKCNELCDISGGLSISDKFSVVNGNGEFRFGDTNFSVGKKIASQLRGSEGAAFFICTAGEGVGAYSQVLMAKGEFLEGYRYDVIGSLTVENAMNLIHDIFEKEMRENELGVTNRYSPGYCEWRVDEQHKLFSFFPESFCGVELSESSLMNPIKSVSGVIGYGSDVKRGEYECNLCNLERCIYRKSNGH
jgi:hypothetical protein